MQDRLNEREFEIAEKNELIQSMLEVFNNNSEYQNFWWLLCVQRSDNVTRHRNFKAVLQLVVVRHAHKTVKCVVIQLNFREKGKAFQRIHYLKTFPD